LIAQLPAGKPKGGDMLRGELVDVRLFRENDLDELVRLWQDVHARGDYYPLGLTSGAVRRREFFETGYWQDGLGRMAIVDKEGRLQGQLLSFRPSTYLSAIELAYIILNPESRGKGYMTEAVRLLTAYLFDLHNVNRIQLTVMEGNEGSRRVAQKCGFKSEGVLRQAFFQKGRFVDIELFSLLRDEQRS
jgi:ribosomal-protein-alanine N-acetyltransferase